MIYRAIYSGRQAYEDEIVIDIDDFTGQISSSICRKVVNDIYPMPLETLENIIMVIKMITDLPEQNPIIRLKQKAEEIGLINFWRIEPVEIIFRTENCWQELGDAFLPTTV